MTEKILVGTDGSGYADTACAYGRHLSARLGAKLTALHVMDSRMFEGPLMADISGWVGASPYAAQLPQFRELMKEKAEAVIAAFRDRAAHEGVEAATMLKTGHPAQVIGEEADAFDLLVLGRRGEHEEFLGEGTGSTVDRVVRHVASTCLVTSKDFRPVGKMLAAFDGSEHARHALETALAWTTQLGVELLVLTVDDGADPEQARAASAEAEALAKERGVAATALIAEGAEGVTLVETAGEQGADLLVLGAYGHSVIREWIVGSTVSYVLHHCDVPTLIVH